MSIYAEKKQIFPEAYAHGGKILAEAKEMYEDALGMFDDAFEMYRRLSIVYKELSEAYQELAESYKELAGTYKEAAAKSKAESQARRDLLTELLDQEGISPEMKEKIKTLLKNQRNQES